MAKPSKLEIEAQRLFRFASLLFARAELLESQRELACARTSPLAPAWMKAKEWRVCHRIDRVWAAQQACIEYELKYPLER